MSVDSNRVVVW